jgi:hypothetical protein
VNTTAAAPALRELPASAIDWALGPARADASGDALTEAIIDAMAYRALAQETLHALHRLQVKHDALRARLRQVQTGLQVVRP